MNPNKIRQQIDTLNRDRNAMLAKLETKGEDGTATYRKFTEDEQRTYDEKGTQRDNLKTVLAELLANGNTGDDKPATATGRVSVAPLDTRNGDDEDDEDGDEDDDETEYRSGPSVRTAPKTKKGKKAAEYSVMKVIRCLAEGSAVTGIEAEISQELAKRSGKHGGMFVPMGALSVTETGRYNVQGERRDLSTTTGAALIRKNTLGMIEYLRSKAVLARAGARFLTDSVGTYTIPRQTGTVQLSWVGEGVSGTPSNPVFDQITMAPHHAIAAVNVTRQFMMQTGIDHEAFVREDIGNAIRLGIDDAGLNADGGVKPTGIFKNADIIANSIAAGLPGGTNGAPFSYSKAIDMESAITDLDADADTMAYITSPRLRGYMKRTEAFAGGGVPVWTGGRDNGEMNGYTALASNLVPRNVTKGTGTNLTKVAFGDWSQVLLALWGSVEFLVNPYSQQMSGAVTISAQFAMDLAVRHAASIVIVDDVSKV